ncbi:MAG: hypothetical protein ACK4UJ_04430 [Leptonema sp. (in: bacteria)]
MYSLMYGYKKLKGEVKQIEGKPILYVEELGYISPLEFIKQGMKFEYITEREKKLLKKGGYRFRD